MGREHSLVSFNGTLARERHFNATKPISVNTSPLERSRARGGRYAWVVTDS
jgi:hypothetical protein